MRMTKRKALKKALRKNGYRLGNMIGKGGTAEIYSLGKHYVLKLFDETMSHTIIQKEYETNLALYNINSTLFLEPVELLEIFVPAMTNNALVKTYGIILERAKPVGTELLTLNEFFTITTDICCCLSEIHKAGYIHSDISLNNILKKDDKHILIDFGVSHRSRGTRLNPCFYGISDYYVPPEALVHQNRIFSVRGDVYSFGMAMRQLLTNQIDCDIQCLSENELLEYKKNLPELQPDDIKNISSLYKQNFVALCSIVNKCTRFNREERYSNADELLADLKLLQSDKSLPPLWQTKITFVTELNASEYNECVSLIRSKQYYLALKLLNGKEGDVAYRLKGEIYYLTNEHKQALDVLSKCKNDRIASFLMYMLLINSKDEKRKNTAIYRLKQSCDAGFAPAQFHYGRLMNKAEYIIMSAQYYLEAYTTLSKMVYIGKIDKAYLEDISTDTLTNSLEELNNIKE